MVLGIGSSGSDPGISSDDDSQRIPSSSDWGCERSDDRSDGCTAWVMSLTGSGAGD